jgi:hypothetical protein
MSDAELRQMLAALTIIYEQLFAHPELYLRQLTLGYLPLLDELTLANKDNEHGHDRGRTFYEDAEAHANWTRPGNLVLRSEEGSRGLGTWTAPDLGFAGFRVVGTGLNDEAMETLMGADVAELSEGKVAGPMGYPEGFKGQADSAGLTTSFYLWGFSPYSSTEGLTDVSLDFVRDPSGRFYIDLGPAGMEWLASYYTGEFHEHSLEERQKYAPLGAAKLYEAIKHKRVTTAVHTEAPYHPMD